ncbi:MAG: hypothetical protein GX792_09210 [Bacteroidales bacterium]|jgi:hypothetical protein|nr:hypothetical protein [Mariniphaga sp.]NLB93588.1 hypothetical protein [Bacteroidales bacterium]
MKQEVFKYQNYQSDYDNYLPEKGQYRGRIKHQTTHVRFVVAWQLENREEKKYDQDQAAG